MTGFNQPHKLFGTGHSRSYGVLKTIIGEISISVFVFLLGCLQRKATIQCRSVGDA